MSPRMVIVYLLASMAAACDGGRGEPRSHRAPNLVFDAPFGQEGRFKVQQTKDGTLLMAVSGGIGIDDPTEILRKVDARSLARTYRALRGDAVDSPVLAELDGRYGGQFRDAIDQRGAAAPAPRLESASFFDNVVCQWHNMGDWEAFPRPGGCSYGARTAVVGVDVDWDDISFALNGNDDSTIVEKDGADETKWPVEPHHWGWYTWPEGRGPVYVFADPNFEDDPIHARLGEVGVTDHGRTK